MATTPARIVVPSRTVVRLAPTGTTAPASATATPAAGWVDVGLTTDDSLSFTTEPEFTDVTSAQSDYPTRIFQTSETATISVDLQEWSWQNFKYVYGGGTVSEVSAGVYKFEPPLLGERSEVAALIDITDGSKHYRYVIPRCQQKEGVQQDLNKGGESKLPLKLTILGGDATVPWYLLTDDSAFSGSS